ncbi:MAG: CARDB domain-containing protein [Dehalococcoidia bacterium]|nr:CARDB domain-containing protein [Dehalococcoidia bacterium]
MKKSGFYPILALVILISLALPVGCSPAAAPQQTPSTPPAPSAPATTIVPAATIPSGTSDLVVTKVWLEDLTVKYTIKNIGAGASPQTYAHLYVGNLQPAMGATSFVDTLQPGEERSLAFTNYAWPFTNNVHIGQVKVQSEGYIDLPLENYKVHVCADGNNEAAEAVETNNCKSTVIGIPWEFDLLPVSNMALWRNNDGDYPAAGSDNEVKGAHYKLTNFDADSPVQLVTIPQQVPNGWMQGIFGYFYSDEFGSSRIGAINMPAKVHFIARIGLMQNATGSDGVTFKFGLKDLNDNVTWLASKTVTAPGASEKWDIDLSSYEGQKCMFLIRVESGATPAKDYAIWYMAKLLQVND